MSAQIAGEGHADSNLSPDLVKIARSALRQAAARVRDPSVVFAFVAAGNPRATGHDDLLAVAHEARALCPTAAVVVLDTPVVIAGAAERAAAAAVSVLAFDGAAVRARLTVIASDAPRDTHARRVADAVRAVPEGARAARLAVAMLASETHTTEALTGLARGGPAPVVGAGTARVVAAMPHRDGSACGAAVLSLATSLGVSIVASPATRLVTPWMRVDALEGPFILRVDGRPMLDVVTEHAGSGATREALLVAVRGPDEATAPLVRAIAGADPARGAVAIGDVLPAGAHIALAVRDPGAARRDLTARLATLARGLGGATPAAALMFSCASRGARFYGRGDVDAGLVRSRFPTLPLAGMQSAFELAPWGDVARVHLYSAVCAVLHRPS